MPHALELFSNAYKRTDPVFSKRSRQLLRSLDRCKAAAKKAASTGKPGDDLLAALRDFLLCHKAFAEAFTGRSQQLYFQEAEQMLEDLSRLKSLDQNAKLALPGDQQAMILVVQELLQP